MICYLTSNLKNYYKEGDIKFPKEIDNSNGIVDFLKKDIKSNKGFLYIASDPSDYEKIDFYVSLQSESFYLSGIPKFKNYYVLDNRTINKVDEYIENSSFIMLAGGHTFTQNEFFKKINLRDKLKNFDGVVLGISAGTVNMAEDVYNSPESEDDLKLPFIYKGLGLTNINAEPHFEINEEYLINFDLVQRDYVLKESYNRDIVGLVDGSHIRVGIDSYLFGEGYKVSNGSIKKVCNKGKSIML